MKKHWKIPAAALTAALALSWVFFSGIEENKIESCRILDRNGVLLREVSSTENGSAYPVKFRELPVYFTKMLVKIEDKRFYSHHGMDVLASARALKQDIKAGHIVSGGSTITQQLVRNMYNNPRNIGSKITETIKAVLVETRYTKQRILEEYLNRIPYGNGVFGVEAASRLYFAKPSGDLSPAECAFLIAIPGATRIYNPYTNPDLLLKRQKRILAKSYARGAIDRRQFMSAVLEKISIYPRDRKFKAPHFCDYLVKTYGTSLHGAVLTTLDSSLQDDVERILSNNISRLKTANVNNAAVVVMDNRTGAVIAYAGSTDYFNEKNSGQINGAAALRQPGSAVKPFIYGMAIESGLTAADIIDDMELHVKVRGGGDFAPRNYDKKYHGPVRLRTALACSYNVATVNMASKFGPQRMLDKLKLAGLKSLGKKASFYGPGLCLGNGEVSLLELTAAYSALACGGRLKKARLICDEPVTEEAVIMPPQAVFIITDILSDNQARQPAFGDDSPLRLPFKCAAKTGTSKDFKDNWAMGFTPDYTVGVWAGNFNMEPMYNVSGISGAAPVFRDIMMRLEGARADIEFKMPDGISTRKICPKSGLVPNPECNEVMDEYFIQGTEPVKTCGIHRAYVEKDAGGPGEDRAKVYEVYPPEYAQWAKENGIEFPRGVLRQGRGRDPEKSQCAVLYPHDGDVFKLDAVLRKEYQVITLKPDAPQNTEYILWHIDGSNVKAGQYPYSIPLKLDKGEHLISFSAIARLSGSLTKSREVKIKVL